MLAPIPESTPSQLVGLVPGPLQCSRLASHDRAAGERFGSFQSLVYPASKNRSWRAEGFLEKNGPADGNASPLPTAAYSAAGALIVPELPRELLSQASAAHPPARAAEGLETVYTTFRFVVDFKAADVSERLTDPALI